MTDSTFDLPVHITLIKYTVGMTVGGGCGPQRNQPKIVFRNHSQQLNGIGQDQMCLQNNPNSY